MFDSNFITNNIPIRYRKKKHVAWLVALMKPSHNLWNTFKAFRNSVRTQIQFNSQTLSLQTWLRTTFINGSITIVNDFSNISPTFAYWLYENQLPTYTYYLAEEEDLPTIYTLEEESNSTLYYDFIVEVPTALQSREDEIRAQLNRMKLASKRYKIEWI